MTLSKTVLTIPIDGGTDEGKDAYQVVPPGNATVVNGRYLTDGSIAKRFGSVLLPSLATATANWSDEGGLHSIVEHDGRVVAIGHDGTVVLDEVNNTWSPLGFVAPRPSQLKSDTLARGNNNLRQPDIAITSFSGKKVACAVWHDTELDLVFYAFYEVPTDGRPLVTLYGPEPLAGDITRLPKVAASADGWFMIAGTAAAGGNVYTSYADLSVSYAFSSPTNLGAFYGGPSSGCIELLSNNEVGTAQSYWVVTDDAGQTPVIRRKRDNTADGSRNVSKAGPLGAAYINDGVNERIVIIHNDGVLTRLNADLATVETSALLFTPSATSPGSGSISQSSTTGEMVAVLSGSVFDTPIDSAVDVVRISSAFGFVSSCVIPMVSLGGRIAWDGTDAGVLIPFVNQWWIRGTAHVQFQNGYIGKPCVIADGSDYVACVATFGLDAFHITEAAWNRPGDVGIGEKHHQLPGLVSVSAGNYVMAYPVLVEQILALDRTSGIDVLRLSTVDSAAVKSVSGAGLRMYQSGAGISCADGVVAAELTPMPYVLGSASTGKLVDYEYGLSSPSGAPGSPPPTIYVKLAYRWRDEKGNVHRGLPSEELSHAWWVLDTLVYYGTGLTFQRPWPMSVNGDTGGLRYEVEVYQADASGGLFYLVGVGTPAVWDDTNDYIVLTSGGPPVYSQHDNKQVVIYSAPSTPSIGLVELWTQLGELLHVPPPPMLDVTSTQDRVWGLRADNGRLDVWPSKVITFGYAPEFAPALSIRIPAEGGECTAIAALDDKVIVFKEKSMFAIFGEPANNNGGRATLQPPRLISSDVGCSNANSIVQGPFGIAFQNSSFGQSGRAGIHVLDKDMSISFVGAPAKTVSAGVTFGSGVLVDREKEVRWNMPADGRTLVWSYDVNRWHTHSQRGVGSAALRRGTYALRLDENFIVLDDEPFANKTDPVELQVTTAWIKPTGLQRFWRVWLSMFLVRHTSGYVTIQVQQDYVNTTTQTVVFTPAESSGLVYKQLAIDMKRQKCEAVRFIITESSGDGQGQPFSYGRGIELVTLEMEVGMKQGSFRRYLPKDNRRG